MGSEAKDYFLQKKYMVKNSGASTKASAEAKAKASAQPTPCAKHGKKTGRVSIFSPWKNRMVSVNPYSANAKKLYKYYIEEMGYDAAWIAPPDLKFYEESRRFLRVKPKPAPD